MRATSMVLVLASCELKELLIEPTEPTEPAEPPPVTDPTIDTGERVYTRDPGDPLTAAGTWRGPCVEDLPDGYTYEGTLRLSDVNGDLNGTFDLVENGSCWSVYEYNLDVVGVRTDDTLELVLLSYSTPTEPGDLTLEGVILGDVLTAQVHVGGYYTSYTLPYYEYVYTPIDLDIHCELVR